MSSENIEKCDLLIDKDGCEMIDDNCEKLPLISSNKRKNNLGYVYL